MTGRGTDYEALTARLAFEEDGHAIRKVGDWTLNKLGLLAYYLPEFAELCERKAGGWYFVDGFAGNGANQCPQFPVYKGTALVGVTTNPPPQRSILVERSLPDVEVLRARVAGVAPSAVVAHGDANQVLPGLLTSTLTDRYLPGFCVLDPEGLELNWKSVEACARHRVRSYPYELLIYFSTPGVTRSGAVRHPDFMQQNGARLNALFGNGSWAEIASRQASGGYAPGEAALDYLKLYEAQLKGLGYKYIRSRPSVRQDGALVYHMVFASANDAGDSIMRYGFARGFAAQLPLQL